MTLGEFIVSVDDLVVEWSTPRVPKAKLEEIYRKVREDTAYECAMAITKAQMGIEIERIKT
jgi:hypothetical protein